MDSRLWRKVVRFQRAQVERLAKLSPKDLLKLPKYQDLEPPPSLQGEKFSVTRSRIAKATYEVSVRYHYPPDPQLEAEFVANLAHFGVPDAEFLGAFSSQRLYLRPDGSIHVPKRED